jgi:enamine deaminase RidA (YjgF/YER057c/UK114 family)
MKKIIKTDEAPAAIGTYSQAVKKGKYYFSIRSDSLKS